MGSLLVEAWWQSREWWKPICVDVQQLTVVRARQLRRRLSETGSGLSGRRRPGDRRSAEGGRSTGRDTGGPGMMMEDAAAAAAAVETDAGDDGNCTAS